MISSFQLQNGHCIKHDVKVWNHKDVSVESRVKKGFPFVSEQEAAIIDF